MSRNNESFASIRYTFVFQVKFEEKEKAKHLRLRWNPALKKWTAEVNSNGVTLETICNMKDSSVNYAAFKTFTVSDVVSVMFEVKQKQKEKLLKHCRKCYRRAQREQAEEEEGDY